MLLQSSPSSGFVSLIPTTALLQNTIRTAYLCTQRQTTHAMPLFSLFSEYYKDVSVVGLKWYWDHIHKLRTCNVTILRTNVYYTMICPHRRSVCLSYIYATTGQQPSSRCEIPTLGGEATVSVPFCCFYLAYWSFATDTDSVLSFCETSLIRLFWEWQQLLQLRTCLGALM